jgi:hypothetical protein
VLEEPESKRAKTTTTKRTINVFYQDIKLPIAFYPGTKTRELVTLILKGMRLPLAPDGRNEDLVTFSDEEGHMTALSSYVDDGASLLMQYRAPSYSVSSDSTTTTDDDDETSDLDSFFSSSTTTTMTEDDDDDIDSTVTDDDDTVIYPTTTTTTTDEERALEVTRIRCKGGEAILQHLCFVRWAMKHIADISAVADAVSHIVLALCNLYEFDAAMQWDFPQATRYTSVDESCQVASTQGDWPYVCTTLGGITEPNAVFRWRVSFSGIASHCAGYLHLGVVYDDERGLIDCNPAMSLMPSIQGYSQRRVYDVIIDTRPQSCAMHLVDVPGLYLYCTPLNRLPAADRPLRLAVWTKLSNQVTIEAFHRYSGSHLRSRSITLLLPSGQPLCASEFAYRHTTVQCQHEDLVR